MEKRLSKKDLMELYGVDRVTIEDWRRNRGLKMIEVSTHSKYITEKDLIEWENSLEGDNKVKRLMNQIPLPEIYEDDIDEITDVDFLEECRGELDVYLDLLRTNLVVFDDRIKELEN